jgi:FMN phosphatase YigB (HAD superfamily)
VQKKIGLLICDLDNTLYDWVTIFSKAFYAMVDAAVPILETEKEQLLDDLQEIHRHYHNTEHPFALLETNVVARKFPGLNSAELYEQLSPAFHAFNSVRKRLLKLYPGVRETLSVAQESGCLIVGHTEATLVNATFRLDKLGLTSMLDRLYAVEHPDTEHPTKSPAPITAVTDVRILGLHERKPDTRVMLEICETSGISPAETLYIGDSIARDIGMANAAGAHSAWAKYGTKYDVTAWESLVRVTHWSPEDVERAKYAAALYRSARPEVTLEESMEELLNHYEFYRSNATRHIAPLAKQR